MNYLVYEYITHIAYRLDFSILFRCYIIVSNVLYFLKCLFQPQNQPETAKRLDFSAKKHSFIQQAINESLIMSEEARNKFSLATFQDLKLKLVDYELLNGWIVWNSDSDKLHIIKLSLSNSLLSVDAYLTIDADLKVRGLYNECQIQGYYLSSLREADNSLQRTEAMSPTCPLFGDSTVFSYQNSSII